MRRRARAAARTGGRSRARVGDSMAESGAGELRAGMRVFDAHAEPLGIVKRVLTLAEVLRWPYLDRDELPPESDFPYLEVTSSEPPRGPLYSGYYIPARAIVRVSGS